MVTGYKQHFDLHFPPTQPTGIIDGFVGPRTLRLLDSHAVLIDTAVAAIEAKRSSLAAAGHSVTFSAASTAEPDTRPIPGTQGAKRSCDDLDGELGMIYFTPSAGACALRGGILFAYLDHGQALGPLGFPATDVIPDGDGFERADFDHGSLRLELASGVVQATLPPSGESVVF